MDAKNFRGMVWPYAGFLNSNKNSDKEEYLAIKLRDHEDYNDVQERVHEKYGEEYKMVITGEFTKDEINIKLESML